VYGLPLGYDNLAAELHCIFVGPGGACGEQKCGKQQQDREQTLRHGDPHSGILRADEAGGSREMKKNVPDWPDLIL
jgi:hypothetical protein